MSCLCRVVLAALFVTLATTRVAWSIEPSAPAALISQDEAIVVAIRQRLDQLPDSKVFRESDDRDALGQFYIEHGRALWVDATGLTDRAKTIITEMSKADAWGLDASKFDTPSTTTNDLTGSALIETEMKMSLAVLKYARHARGGRMDPRELSLAIDRVPPLEDPKTVLTSLLDASDPAAYLRDLHPKHDQFEKLRLAYLKALDDEANPASAPTAVSNEAEATKKKSKSKRSRKKTRSKTKLSQRLLYNMEMWRWMPRELGTKFVWSNIPEYRMRVVKNGEVVHAERIVTGKVKNKTPIFSDKMETIVFHPFWGVPNSIKVKEILPSLVRGANILEKQNLKISYGGRPVDPYSVDWSTTDIRKFHVFQPPSRRNALGVVKFMFPNKHAVYMHDTPSKHLFKRKARAFSHGCVRVRDPLKLAEVLLNHDKGWNRSKINALVDSGPKNNQISLDNKFPVHVTYFTARIDDEGKPRLYKDVYGHERLIQMGLDGKSHLIVKKKPNLDSARRRVVSNTSGSFYKKKNSNWIEQIFNN